jgi:molybdenum cofactor cytidylyltransferase
MPSTVHILILAAGASSRMRGLDKLLQPVDGIPILRRTAEAALATGSPVTVALPSASAARRQSLAGLELRLIEVPDAAQGMSRSLVRGTDAITETSNCPTDGLMVLPGDMPGFTAAALSGMIERSQASPQLIWRGGTADGQVGHPAIFPRDLWPDLLKVSGDEGGRSVLQAHRDRVSVLVLPEQMAVQDLDTPEEWAAYLGRPL